MEDPELLGRVLAGPTWKPWRILLIAMAGEGLTDAERVIFTRLTGRAREPLQFVEEFWGIAGRRAGKSRAMACLIVFLAIFRSYRHALAMGERAVVLCLGQTQEQARVVWDYVVAILEETPLFRGLVKQKGGDGYIALSNGVDIMIKAASFRGLRGLTLAACVCDEICFWFTETTNSDAEILAAVRPALLTTNGPLIAISTPYARRGVAYETWNDHFGAKGDPLVMVAAGGTRDFNESVSQRKIDRELQKDEAFARAEYLGEWRSDIDTFLGRELIEGLIDRGVTSRQPLRNVAYEAFVDSSAGVEGGDSFTMAIGHRGGPGEPRVVVDLIMETKPKFDPARVTAEYCATLKCYGVSRVTGDRYAPGYNPGEFRRNGVTYVPSEKPKSDLYLTALPMMTSGQVLLLDHRPTVLQLAGLQRRTTNSGREVVDHAQNKHAHDDVANVICGLIAMLATGKAPMRIFDGRLGVSTRLPTSYGSTSGWRSAGGYERWPF